MRYYVLDRGDPLSVELTQQFHKLAEQRGFELDAESPEIVVSIGGDGTMLHAFHTFIDRIPDLAFVGVHTGHLGFYADWKADELHELIDHMSGARGSDSHPRIVKYPLVQLEIHKKSGTSSYIALNEFTLKGIDGTVVAQIDINDVTFEMFRGDGICVSTPSGSTAYNKSVGGAMVHPSIEALQIAEIASINNRIFRTLGSPLLLPKHHHCDIFSRKEQRLLLTVDHINITIDDLISVRCQVAEQEVSFARYRPFPFWNRVRDAFLG
ncbi:MULTISPECIES: NAD kinase [Paenibacillus]|uniref:NAD kinase n=1 Tax=Paenibacillus campinasensis TaxID=66347 RepID=A0A268EXS7_9BACL|nr:MULTISPECIES: NAD kinase [Paenibacillus]MUG66449.1 NAD kinase [Paenibacillus campinasensis]PAD77917.1 NAD kinase [Paenibacillus campinasensis]PAK53001.1 NAD kinase [Paenibacillus sp. 7541]